MSIVYLSGRPFSRWTNETTQIHPVKHVRVTIMKVDEKCADVSIFIRREKKKQLIYEFLQDVYRLKYFVLPLERIWRRTHPNALSTVFDTVLIEYFHTFNLKKSIYTVFRNACRIILVGVSLTYCDPVRYILQ